MVKTIDTLIPDIEKVLTEGVKDWTKDYELKLTEIIKAKLTREGKARKPTLRMSNIGSPCNRKLWYSINADGQQEDFPPATRFKFLFGDIIEEVVLFLAQLAGHTVEGRQDEQEIEGIKGHRDAIIDGMVVDVKSASSYSFKKFKDHKLAEDDSFGYIDQLQSYLYASQDDPKVTIKDQAAFLVIDKQMGHMTLDIHQKNNIPYDKLYKFKKDMVVKADPPERGFAPEPEGKSGNLKLGVNCSYCDFKKTCYPQLRTFLYSYKPIHLVKVLKEPNVPELRGLIEEEVI